MTQEIEAADSFRDLIAAPDSEYDQQEREPMSKQESKVIVFTAQASMDSEAVLNIDVDAPEEFNESELALIADAVSEAIARAATRHYDKDGKPLAEGEKLMVELEDESRLDYIERALADLGREVDPELGYIKYADRLDVSSYDR
jgi:hypothetical protein